MTSLKSLGCCRKYVAVKTAESVRALATDMLAALSEVGSEVSAKANDTFSQIFSLASLNTTQRVLGLMHRGQLPLEYYLRPIDVEVEMAFLDSIVDKMEVTIIVCSLVTTVCILLCCGLLCSFLSSRSDVRKANEEEEKAVSELGAAEEQKKKLIRSQETKDAEARKLYMALLSGEGGPLGMALTRPNNRRRRPS